MSVWNQCYTVVTYYCRFATVGTVRNYPPVLGCIHQYGVHTTRMYGGVYKGTREGRGPNLASFPSNEYIFLSFFLVGEGSFHLGQDRRLLVRGTVPSYVQ